MKRISPDSAVDFAALAAAVHPAWHQAIIRLANSTERLAFRMEAFMGASMETGFISCARDLAKTLIDFLDEIDGDPDLESTLAGLICRDAAADECEPPGDDEPSLGSFDRMTNQDRGWRQVGYWASGSDLEEDTADDEPSLGSCGSDQTHWSGGSRDDREHEENTGTSEIGGLIKEVGN